MVCLLQGFVFRLGHSQAPHIADMTVWARYRAVFAVRPALRYMLLQALAFSVMLIFITHSSFIYQQHFGAGPGLFAILFGANIVLMLAANLLNRKLLQRIAAQRILRAALMLQALGIGLLIIIAALDASLWFFLPAMMLTVGTMGAITPNIQACYMEYFASHGGTASALLGAAQFSIAGLLSAATTLLPETLLLIVISQAVCSALCLALIVKKSTS
jgi:DHA1 family bicyclomycin/chloramphenicol resistance-like MFS transporter